MKYISNGCKYNALNIYISLLYWHLIVRGGDFIAYDTNYITNPSVPSVQKILLGSLNNLKYCDLGIKVAESDIPRRIFLLQWEMTYKLTREIEMIVAGMGLVLCAAALEIEEEKKRPEKEAWGRLQVKRRK